MRSLLAPFLALLLLIAALLPATGRCAPAVVIVTADATGPYGEFIEAFRAGLRGTPEPVSVTVSTPSQWAAQGAATASAASEAALVIPLGAQATQSVLAGEGRVPVLSALIPRRAWERIRESGSPPMAGRALSAVFLDQPASRRVTLLQIAFPERRRWLLPSGPESRRSAEFLAAAARERGIEVHIEPIADQDELYPALARLLEKSDLLVGLPDPLIFNSRSIRGLLLSSYRYRVPVFAFSPTYARAGALLTLSSTPRQIAAQVLKISRRVLEGHPLPAPVWPQEFQVDVNEAVARSLDIALPSAAELQQRLLAKEANR